jgi:hypothetical protein
MKSTKPKESSIEKAFVRKLKELGVESLKLELQHNAGWPDRLVLIPGGRPIFIELKRPGENLRALQVERISFLKSIGYDARVFLDVSAAINCVRDAMEAP